MFDLSELDKTTISAIRILTGSSPEDTKQDVIAKNIMSVLKKALKPYGLVDFTGRLTEVGSENEKIEEKLEAPENSSGSAPAAEWTPAPEDLTPISVLDSASSEGSEPTTQKTTNTPERKSLKLTREQKYQIADEMFAITDGLNGTITKLVIRGSKAGNATQDMIHSFLEMDEDIPVQFAGNPMLGDQDVIIRWDNAAGENKNNYIKLEDN